MTIILQAPGRRRHAMRFQRRGRRRGIHRDADVAELRLSHLPHEESPHHVGALLGIELAQGDIDHGRRRAAQHGHRIEDAGQPDAPALVGLDRDIYDRARIGAGLDRQQVRARRPHRQHRAERRRIAQIVDPRAAARAIHPQRLAIDRRAHQHMVERSNARQPFRHEIAHGGTGRYRLCLYPHAPQQCQQQQGLGLAIAIAQRPGLCRGLGHIIAAIHADRQIADAILHQLQRRSRLRARRPARCLELVQFARQPATRRDQPFGRIERCHRLGNIGPGREGGQFEQRWMAIAQRRILRHLRLLDQWQGDGQFVEPALLLLLDHCILGQQFPLGPAALIPLDTQPPLSHPQRRGEQPHRTLDMSTERIILHRRRIAKADNIADLHPFDRQRRGKNASNLPRFQIFLAAQHGKALVARQRIDHLVAAQDRHFMDDEVALVGCPWQGERR